MKNIPVRHIAQPASAFSATGFRIRSLDEILLGEDLDHALHRHDFYFILAIEKGQGWHEVDFSEYQVCDYSIFIIRPGQVHQLKLKAGTTGFLAEFDSSFYHPQDKLSRQRLTRAGNKDYCTLEQERFSRLSRLLMYILEEYRRRQEDYTTVIKATLDVFFIEFMRQGNDIETSKKPDGDYAQGRLDAFVNLLETNIATHKQVANYASLLNLSVYQLNAITKTALGKPASTLITDQVILEAKRYLLATTNQVKEIADLLGYEDISYFIRFFRKHTGFTPDAFRKHSK